MTEKQTTSKMLPAIPLDLSQHKLSIALNWILIVLFSGILPIVLYFALEYGTDLSETLILTVTSVIMGASSLWTLFQRTWYLLTDRYACRPLQSSSTKWYHRFDYFHWNFLFGFVALTILISVATSIPSLPTTSVSISVLLLYVCLELVLVEIGIAMGTRAPFRMSSIPKGGLLKPGVFVVAEDIVAVDGKRGRDWRKAWIERYEADPEFRALLRMLDWAWGISGLCIVAIIWGLAFSTSSVNEKVAYGIGWGLPWIWGGTLTLFTIWMAKRMLKRQRARVGSIDSGV